MKDKKKELNWVNWTMKMCKLQWMNEEQTICTSAINVLTRDYNLQFINYELTIVWFIHNLLLCSHNNVTNKIKAMGY